jgi:hypothetical protein
VVIDLTPVLAALFATLGGAVDQLSRTRRQWCANLDPNQQSELVLFRPD